MRVLRRSWTLRFRDVRLTEEARLHSVTNLLKAWVREYMDNEDLNRELLRRIRDFATHTMTEKGQSLQICKSVDERVRPFSG